MVLAASGMCSEIQLRSPPAVKKSITVGLGLFQALVGFDSVQLIVRGDTTLLSLGQINANAILALVGLISIGIMLCFKIKAAMLIGIAAITAVAWAAGLAPLPDALCAAPSLTVRLLFFCLFIFVCFKANLC